MRWRQIARKNRAVLFFPTEERRGRIGSRAATQLPKLSDLGINKSGTTKGRTVSASPWWNAPMRAPPKADMCDAKI